MSKVGRNDPCPCGSGKKFKKCCENKMIGKKFMASKIETSEINKSSSLSSFFQKKITPISTPDALDKSKNNEKKDINSEIKKDKDNKK
ncbi:MAG: hypothetical protein A3F40_03470 [Chlamydiae bacterium RIFCSPHIGHO2_12_FULL_27_8]|nr:MAG: hypothetical protein A3F40_03470 [Chlamydiae bacterium RIFCSPHIGHO2_12_FULL_27_8]OGN66620.1 MAG: hypothetical protein A2888_02450 [Chlamydiae bacterium RIFCSPLOWO2_01_FULL_28_7]